MMQLTKNIKLITWFNFLIALRPYASVAIIYFSLVTHSYALGISIFSITQLAQAVFEIPTGIYSDMLGRRNCLIIGACTSVLSVICYAIGHTYLILALGAILQGAYFAFFNGNNAALLYETLVETGEQEKYDEVLGNTSSMFTLAFAMGGVIGGILVFWSFTLLMWLSVIPQLLCLVVSFLIIEPPVHREKTGTVYAYLREAFTYFVTNGQLRRLSLANIIGFGVGEAQFQFQAVFFNTLLPVWTIGFLSTINNLIGTLSYRLSGRLISKLKAINLLIYGEIYTRIINVIALAFPTIVSPFLMTSTSLFFGTGEVAQNTLLQQELSDRQRATMPSINSLLGSCLFAPFAFLIGSFADHIGVAKTLLLAQLFLLPVIWLYWKIFHTSRKLKQ